ncbi:MAG: hypothetical protein FD143_3277 [Ignavibacteria bacterium]|nr:MAG: hypothetical protein FD143_3277 [Ignavibacteria bacterium]KAF0153667.1 MAG: hypothetical protein FD188_3370 [Ignavibacteria bacterium]
MIGFFEEKEGVKSSMRLMSFLLLLFMFVFDFGFMVGQIQLGKVPQLDMNFIIMNFVFLIGVFAPKYLQKIAELKLGKPNES